MARPFNSLPLPLTLTLTLTVTLLLILLSISAIQASASHKHEHDYGVTSSDDAPSSAVLLSTLLAKSRHRPLLHLTGVEFDRFTRPSVRPYTLVIFLTASQQCAACNRVENEMGRLAGAYERARYVRHGDQSDRTESAEEEEDEESRASLHPTHHIFFLALDAHRVFTKDGRDMIGAPGVQGEMRNLGWFQANKITKVPELFILPFTPIHTNDTSSPSSVDGSVDIPLTLGRLSRYARRMSSVDGRRAARVERLLATMPQVNLTSEAPFGGRMEFLRPLPPESTVQATPTQQQQQNSTADVPSWRDPKQIRAYPIVQSVTTALQLRKFVREQTEGHVDRTKQLIASNTSSPMARPLAPGMVVRSEGLSLVDAIIAPEASQQPTGPMAIIQRMFGSLTPFVTSIMLFVTTFIFIRYRYIKFAALPMVFYLWNVAGSMNNILKDMPVIGMGQHGPMFFYPGHGSFVGESVLVAILYGYCSLMILFLNLLPLYQRMSWREFWNHLPIDLRPECYRQQPRQPQQQDQHRSNPADPSQSVANSAESVSIESSVVAATAASESTSTSAVSSTSRSDNLKGAKKPASSHTPPFSFPPTVWVVFLIFTFHFAFSILRTIYTRKNGRYRHGYLI